MEQKQTYKNYTAAEIMAYLKGQMTEQDMYALEKQALEDPLLADAVEGYALIHAEESKKILAHLNENLSNTEAKVISINGNTASSKSKWWRVAAAAASIGIVFGLANVFFKGEKNNGKQVAADAKSTVDTAKKVGNTSTEITESNGTGAPKKPIAEQDKAAVIDYAFVKPEQLDDYLRTGTYKLTTIDSLPIKDIPTSVAKLNTDDNSSITNSALPTPANSKQEEFVIGKTNESEKMNTPVVSNNSNINGNTMAAAEFKVTVDKALMQPNTNIGKADYNKYFYNYAVVNNSGIAVPFTSVSIPQDQVNTYGRADGRFGLYSADTTLVVNLNAFGYLPKTVTLTPSTEYRSLVLEKDTKANDGAERIVITSANAKRKANLDSTAQMFAPVIATIQLAEPVDGAIKYNTYISNNLSAANIPKGEVVLSFEVSQTGDATNIKVERSANTLADNEAVRLLSQGPKFKVPKRKKNRKAKIVIKL